MIICEKLMHGHPPHVPTLHPGHQMRQKNRKQKIQYIRAGHPKACAFQSGWLYSKEYYINAVAIA